MPAIFIFKRINNKRTNKKKKKKSYNVAWKLWAMSPQGMQLVQYNASQWNYVRNVTKNMVGILIKEDLTKTKRNVN